jgi:hypothetical protein
MPPRKSKKAVIVEKPATPELLSLTEAELLKMRVADLEAQVAQRDVHLAELRKAYIALQVDPKGMLAAQEQARITANREFEIAKADYRKVLATACARFGIDPARASVNPETGVISILG